ncbi:MAG: hypothetical protein H7Y00_06985 [Fimbriimonadaceae bacterium]|nr:hypothetical protein [Chitinophagales bacterium]
MLEQLLDYAKDNMQNIMDGIPELQQMDKQKALDITGQSVISNIMEQVKDGNFSGLKEMLNGSATPLDHEEVKKLENPVTDNLLDKLGLSKNTASVLALAAIPLILNMLNNKVNTAKNNGLDINDYMNKMETGGGLLTGILKAVGAKKLNPSGKIAEQLINQIMK